MVDASLQEEACCLAQLLVSVNGNNNICAMQKVGPGALDPDSIFEMIEVKIHFHCVLKPKLAVYYYFFLSFIE